jgi:hypothetical protein
MCRKHLLGEHNEIHMFIGAIKKHKKLHGYLKNNLFEPKSLWDRHANIVQEMLNRGYNHQSELEVVDISTLPDIKIDADKSLIDLITRCNSCRDHMISLDV